MITCLRSCAGSPAVALASWLSTDPVAGSRLIDFLPRAEVRWFASGRMALYQGLAAQGIGAGDEVVVPPYVAAGVVDPIHALGARTRFVASGPGLRVDFAALDAACGPRTRAVVVVHHLAQPQPVAELADWCRRRGVLLVEDCAQALLSRHPDGTAYGSHGDMALFSLTKLLPVSDGAALVVREPARAPAPAEGTSRTAVEAAELMRAHLAAVDAACRAALGRDDDAWRVVESTYRQAYEVVSRDFAASLPTAPSADVIARLDAAAFAGRRRTIVQRVASGIANPALAPFGDWHLPGIVPMALGALVPADQRSDWVARALRSGVQLSSLVHLWDYTDGVLCPNDVDHRDRHVLIPVGENLDDASIDHLVRTINRL
jgi:dTDP-4-amino-4,6-dideoxygalactose transaminase